MRTTLDIDNEVLQAAREIARSGKTSTGAVISELAHKGLAAPSPLPPQKEREAFHGFRPLPKRGGIVTNDLIDKLRGDDID